MTKKIKPLNEKVVYGSGDWGGGNVIKVEDVKNKTNRVKERLKEEIQGMPYINQCMIIDKIFQEEINLK